ncbi:Zinc transporter ZIP1 [Aphelenchoides besseyi]|nr:Zinc transporter ZIP1 [Aphelenchoides besseyi]
MKTTTVDPIPPAPLVPTRNALKSVLLLVLFFATFLASISALVLKRAARSSSPNSRAATAFSLISCFGGGVFLATVLMHLLPESMQQIEKARTNMKWDSNFPLAELCISLGFMFVLTIEQVSAILQVRLFFAHEREWIGSIQHQRLMHHEHEESTVEVETEAEPVVEDEHFEHETHSTMRAVLLVLAISLHAVFEGLSVGMIVDVAALLQICGALLIHKTIIGMSLGIRLVQSNMRSRTVVICCVVFSGQILIGGFAGLGIMRVLNHESFDLATFISGILQAFAAGTFLYITCFEILPHELNKKRFSAVEDDHLGSWFCADYHVHHCFPRCGRRSKNERYGTTILLRIFHDIYILHVFISNLLLGFKFTGSSEICLFIHLYQLCN